MRTGPRFGVILNRKHRQAAMAHSFQTAIVQIEVRQFNVVQVQAVRINREAVIVGRDFAFAAAVIFDRLIASAMTEFQLEGFSAESQSQNLMSQANAEHRRSSQQL